MTQIDAFSKSLRRILIGIGGYAANLINALDDQTLNGLDFLAMDRCDAFPADWDPSYLIPMKKVAHHLGRSDTILSARDAEESLIQNTGLFDGASFVFVIAALGGGCASGATPVLLRYLKRLGIPTFAFLTVPSEEIEGRKKWMIAQHALSEIKQDCSNFLIVKAYPDTHREFSGYHEDSNQSNLFKLQFLIDLMRLPAVVPCDISWFGAWSNAKEKTGLLIAEGAGRDRAVDAACRLLGDPEIKPFLKRNCTILMQFMSSGDLKLKELDDATGILRNAWQNDIDIHYSVITHKDLHGSIRLGVIVGEASRSITVSAQEGLKSNLRGTDQILQAGQIPTA